LGVKNVELRLRQFRQAVEPATCLRVARRVVAGKIRNQRTLLQRNHVEPPSGPLALMKQFAADAERAESLESLLGFEGNAARIYFEHLSGMIKVNAAGDELEVATHGKMDGKDSGAGQRAAAAIPMPFDFTKRNRRPPRDPVNAMLSLAYSLLAKDLTIVCHAVGFDPYLGFYHQPRFGRAALAVDLMEPFRPLIADSAVLTAINTRMVTPSQFVRGAAMP
jgi:CRISPR-associated protein Cas1